MTTPLVTVSNQQMFNVFPSLLATVNRKWSVIKFITYFLFLILWPHYFLGGPNHFCHLWMSFLLHNLRWYRTDALRKQMFNVFPSLLATVNRKWSVIKFITYVRVNNWDKIYNSQLLRNIFLKASVRYHRNLIYKERFSQTLSRRDRRT